MNNDYLSRPLIDGMRYDISDTHVMIQCPHTCFVNYELPCHIDRDVLLRQYHSVLAMARAQGIKINYDRHIHRTIRQLWPEYKAARAEQEALFSRLRELAQEVKARGIHVGTVDDVVLSAMLEISGQLAVYGYRTSATSQIARIGRDLANLELGLSDGHGSYCMIAV